MLCCAKGYPFSSSLQHFHRITHLPIIQCIGRLSIKSKASEPPQNKVKVVLKDEDLHEKYTKGSGPGGQKINKRSIRVVLTHIPSGVSVKCQDFRDLTTNRKHARTLLRDKLDLLINGDNSKLGKRHDKIRKRKVKNASRTKKKYGTDGVGSSSIASKLSDSDDHEDSDSDFDTISDINDGTDLAEGADSSYDGGDDDDTSAVEVEESLRPEGGINEYTDGDENDDDDDDDIAPSVDKSSEIHRRPLRDGMRYERMEDDDDDDDEDDDDEEEQSSDEDRDGGGNEDNKGSTDSSFR